MRKSTTTCKAHANKVHHKMLDFQPINWLHAHVRWYSGSLACWFSLQLTVRALHFKSPSFLWSLLSDMVGYNYNNYTRKVALCSKWETVSHLTPWVITISTSHHTRNKSGVHGLLRLWALAGLHIHWCSLLC